MSAIVFVIALAVLGICLYRRILRKRRAQLINRALALSSLSIASAIPIDEVTSEPNLADVLEHDLLADMGYRGVPR